MEVGTRGEVVFPADCTGVRLPLWLLLFVYYNLDTIIWVSSSRAWTRSDGRLGCRARGRETEQDGNV